MLTPSQSFADDQLQFASQFTRDVPGAQIDLIRTHLADAARDEGQS